jgi:hypothetical protein
MEGILTSRQKALEINQDGTRFGTFAEIGAGQEVVRWFFVAGDASATVAKSISAYDTTLSDDIYGHADHYVSRGRLTAMLDFEYKQLIERLDAKRGERSRFFVFGETAATHTRPHQAGGHGWMGVRFQTDPRSQPSEVILHAQMLESVTGHAQDAIGRLGVNLIHAAFYEFQHPQQLIGALKDNLDRDRIEIDVIRFSGPAFSGVDNRVMSLELIDQGLTHSAMFSAAGEVMQCSEVLSGKPVLVGRGTFRPITNVALAVMDRATAQLREEAGAAEYCVALMEISMHNLRAPAAADGAKGAIDYGDFLARADTLGALGKMVMISDFARFDELVGYLRQYTREWIVMALGMPVLGEIFDGKYYTGLDGGTLEGIGRLFRGSVKLYAHPTKSAEGKVVASPESLKVGPEVTHLYTHLIENRLIVPIREFADEQLQISPAEVRAKIESGEPGWEQMVPPEVAELIKQRSLFGYRGSSSQNK